MATKSAAKKPAAKKTTAAKTTKKTTVKATRVPAGIVTERRPEEHVATGKYKFFFALRCSHISKPTKITKSFN